MTGREMTAAAAAAMGLRLKWEEAHGCHWIDFGQGIEVRPWEPRDDKADSFDLAAALRITVEHSPAEEKHPWVCASVSTHVARVQQFLEDVPNEPKRAAAMRLAILRCAASQPPANG